jgi:IPT/TIG domain
MTQLEPSRDARLIDRLREPLTARRADLIAELGLDADFDEEQLVHHIDKLKGDPELLSWVLPKWIDWWRGPKISDFAPRTGYAGDVLDIVGSGFDADRLENTVTVGGAQAMVLQATPTTLKVLTDDTTVDGPVTVQVGAKTGTGPDDFRLAPYPLDDQDGPPISYAGQGEGQSGDVSSKGTGKILVVLVNPSDRVPANASTTRTSVVNDWDRVRTYYEQASYFNAAASTGKSWAITTTSGWSTLSGTTSDYCDFSAAVENVKQAALPRLMAEAAKAATDAGHNLNTFDIMAVVLNLNGTFIRAWGGWDQQNFSYDPGGGGTKINISLTKAINLLAVQETANWGRLAHEVGHNIVAVPGVSSATTKGGTSVFGEDVYGSDLVTSSTATAAPFDLMGNHDNHPLFSGHFLDTLGWYRPDNPSHDGDILSLDWSRNAFSQDIEVVAHGLARNTVAGRYHLIKIKVANGLCYYVQVRQRPGGTTAAQVFDDSIPGTSGPTDGGVIVTRVITDTNADNQQGRVITLLHDQTVLHEGQTAVDPARALTITVLEDEVVNRPLVCRVRVAWAQGIADDPNGAFDLNITPWDGSCTTPDIWVDRIPTEGMFDKANDSEGRPLGNGDKPKPGALNKFVARVNNSGTVDAADVKVTFYAVFPPGVGDNGAWSPLVTRTIGTIPKNGHFDIKADWVPIVGKHTCLKVYASAQLGEISGGNNSAQENVFDFEAPAFSPPMPLVLPVALRNPRDEDVVAQVSLKQVPRGFHVQFPHQWVHLKAHEERQFDMVVVPTYDISAYLGRKETVPTAPILLHGFLDQQYDELLPTGELPGSRFSFMGGVLSNVTPKRGTTIELYEEREDRDKTTLGVAGYVAHAGKEDHVTVTATDRDSGAELGVQVGTDDASHFQASIDLRELAKLAGRDPDDIGGTYDVVAATFASPTVAEATSPTITVVR